MTRRRIVALILGVLVAVYVAASVITVLVVRDRLIDAVDDDLETSVDNFVVALERLDLDDLGMLDVEVNERAVFVYDGREEVLAVPAGARSAPLPLPELTASTVVSRLDAPFDAESADGSLDYRVLATALPDGTYLAVAQPLDDLRDALIALSRWLLITLFAVIAVLGLVFWWLLRMSLRPYDDMIATARAIAAGDLDRRATAATPDPGMQQLAESLNAMLDRIQESFAAKEAAESRLHQFVADASHELRTPLTSISGYSELYLSGAATDDEAVTTQMMRINTEAARLARLVEELLTLARLDEGRVDERRVVDLAEVARNAAVDHLAAVPDADVGVDLPADGAALVLGDPDALRQVVTNLLANATQHNPAGTAILLGVMVDGADDVVLRVRDDGTGMDAATAAHAFDRFYRGDKARGRSGGSSGLGLSIVAAIVDAHDGTIELDAPEGSGTTVTVHLPRST